MSELGLPSDLVQAFHDLAKKPEPAPVLFERVARWRRACGDAEAAATWQTWSLLPPQADELRHALATIWSGLGEVNHAEKLLGTAPGDEQPLSWLRLKLLIQQGDFEQAATMQQVLLQNPPVVQIADLLNLLHLWQENKRSQQALELLDPLLNWIKDRGEIPTIQLCLAVADLLEQQQRFDEAETWWQRSHGLQPDYAWPLMRLGQQALRKQQPAVALHYATQVLERNPDHDYAPHLQRKALTALGAERSLAILDGTPLSQLEDVSGGHDPEPEWWQGCNNLALIGFDNTGLLRSWLGYLREVDHKEFQDQKLQLWLIACPDPLWLEQRARNLFEQLPQLVLINSWPVWDEQWHGGCSRSLEALAESPYWREREQGA